MGNIFQEVLFRPLFNLVVAIADVIPGHDFGIAIIILTLAIRILLIPLSMKMLRSQRAMAALAPKVKEIKDKYKKDLTTQNAEVMKLYKENNVSPLSGCLPLLIQLPILIGLYKAFIAIPDPESYSLLYSFVEHPETVNTLFLGLLDIGAKTAYFAIPIGALQFIQGKLTQYSKVNKGDKSDPMAAMSGQMLYFMPFMLIIISWNLPFGLTLYWSTTILFSIGEALVFKKRTAV